MRTTCVMPTSLPPSSPLLTAGEMKACETQAIQKWGIFSLVLQEHAALGALALLGRDAPIHVLAGPGNNGGDALALARLARLQGRDVNLWPLTSTGAPTWKGDAAVQARLWEGMGGGYRHVADPAQVIGSWRGWVVDGLFGLGSKLPIPPVLLPWLEALNGPDRHFKVLSLDSPTGLDPSSGEVAGPVLRADSTACFGHMKRCHGLRPAKDFCGDISVVPIPLPQAPPSTLSLLRRPGILGARWDAHKYDHGHVTIRAGNVGMGGAVALAAMGALRGGAGLVTVLTEAAVVGIVASQVPEAMVAPWEGRLPDKTDVLLVGPGGVEEIPDWDGPLVLDASALRDGDGAKWMGRPNTIITPHAGEFSRLFGAAAPKGTQGRLAAIEKMLDRLDGPPPGALVLKGAQTLLTGGGSRHIFVNPTGHPGLATGGTGDFLAGLASARFARHKDDPLKAASQAVWLHGAAADSLGEGPLLAGDLGPALAKVFRGLSGA